MSLFTSRLATNWPLNVKPSLLLWISIFEPSSSLFNILSGHFLINSCRSNPNQFCSFAFAICFFCCRYTFFSCLLVRYSSTLVFLNSENRWSTTRGFHFGPRRWACSYRFYLRLPILLPPLMRNPMIFAGAVILLKGCHQNSSLPEIRFWGDCSISVIASIRFVGSRGLNRCTSLGLNLMTKVAQGKALTTQDWESTIAWIIILYY